MSEIPRVIIPNNRNLEREILLNDNSDKKIAKTPPKYKVGDKVKILAYEELLEVSENFSDVYFEMTKWANTEGIIEDIIRNDYGNAYIIDVDLNEYLWYENCFVE